jgi:acetoin utilization deacetylase AcuC-like enzyme
LAESQGKKGNTVNIPNESGLNDQLLLETWSLAERIIEEFNEYGGGPESE